MKSMWSVRGVTALAIATTFLAASASAQEATREGPNPRHVEHSIQSALLGASKPLHVYLPPGFDSSGATRYPVLYYLHGLNNTAGRFFREGLPEITDRLIEEKKIEPFILASPTGDYSFFVNKHDGSAPYEDHVVQEVRAFVEERYPARTDRAGRAVGGISMGGYGALKIAMRFPELYCAASGHTPFLMRSIPEAGRRDRRSQTFRRLATGVFGDPLDEELWKTNDPFSLVRANRFGDLALYHNSASKDRYFLNIEANAFDRLLTEQGIDHVFRPIDDVHGWVSLRNEWENILTFHNGIFSDSMGSVTDK